MSAATLVPETWELSGDDACETLQRTGRTQLVQDAFVRFRASDGFSHARSLAFVISLVLIQGLIVMVGLAAALGDTDVSATIVRTITEAVPGPAGKALTNAVFHAYKTGRSGQNLVLVLVGVAALVTGTTLMGQIERALNRLYGIEQDRPTLQKYGRAFVLALTAGALATASFAMFALGHGIGQGIGNDTATQVWNVLRWPIALVLMTVVDRAPLPVVTAPPPTGMVVARVRVGRVGHPLVGGDPRPRPLLPGQHDVQHDVRPVGGHDRHPAVGAPLVGGHTLRRCARRAARGRARRRVDAP